MSEGVVIRLEPVDVGERDGERARTAATRSRTRRDLLIEPAAVGQPGEDVGVRLLSGVARGRTVRRTCARASWRSTANTVMMDSKTVRREAYQASVKRPGPTT